MTVPAARFRVLLSALALALVGPLSATSHAVTTNWNVGSGGFNSAGSWDNGVPGADDLAVFRRGNVPAYSVTFGNLLAPISPTINRLIVGTNTLTFNVTNSSLTVDEFLGRFGFMVIGDTASDVAVLTSNLANLSAHDATLGDAAGSSGTLNLTTGTAKFGVTGTDATYDLAVGSSGTGAINVSGGADVTVADDTVLGLNATGVGNVSVSGVGSTWTSTSDLTVGSAGSGTLDVGGGANVAVGGVVLVGTNGTVNFSVASSAWSSGKIHLSGTFNITSGATLSGTAVSLESGTLAVTGADSSWIPSSTDLSSGTVNISIGGRVLDSTNSLLPFPSAIPTGSVNVNVSSGGSLITGSNFNQMASLYPGRRVSVTGADSVWRSNVGQLDVEAGTRVTVSDGGRFEYIGEVTVNSGGEVAVQGAGAIVRPNPVGVLNIGESGTLTVSNGGTVLGPVFVERSASGVGTLKGNGNVDSFDSDGIIAPGDLLLVGALHVLSDCSFRPSGTLQIKLGGTTPESEHDQLIVTNTAQLQGTLEVNLVNGFIPSFGQTFTILTADDVDGTFASEVFPSVPNLAFDVIYNAQSIVLTVLSALPGDYNQSGTVDAADYTVWRDNLGGTSLPNESASLGTVDDLDYDFWKLHFGETAGAGSGATGSASALPAVPEPASLLLMCFGLFAALPLLRCIRTDCGRAQRGQI